MMLENKVAVVYGAGGAIGGAVARAFAREGAQVYLSGRTKAKVDKVAADIRTNGGTAESAELDALDEKAVNTYVDSVVEQAGRIDISFNVISVGDVQKPLAEITLAEFLQPIDITMRTQFITTKAASTHMIRQKSGVILHFGGSGPQTVAGLGGFKISLDALEGLRRQWAIELGEHNIRVLTIKTGGIPETIITDTPEMKEIAKGLEKDNLLKRAATLEDVGNVAAFLASDRARTITSTEVNISSGSMVD